MGLMSFFQMFECGSTILSIESWPSPFATTLFSILILELYLLCLFNCVAAQLFTCLSTRRQYYYEHNHPFVSCLNLAFKCHSELPWLPFHCCSSQLTLMSDPVWQETAVGI